MRFLLDQPISWMVGKILQKSGHEVVHVRDLGMAEAGDEVILQRAAKDGCVIITQDTDFGTLLSRSAFSVPSVVLFRMHNGRPNVQAKMLLDNIDLFEKSLQKGAIVVLTDANIRIRDLPI